VALVILSGMDVNMLLQSVSENNLTAFVRLPGIGKKTAERLLIDLRDRLPTLLEGILVLPGANQPATRESSVYHDAVNALQALGYKLAEAKQLVQSVSEPQNSCEDLIRLALQSAR
jgi:Holliday junction DNA helicase RuvA